jgi:hypothetical protein
MFGLRHAVHNMMKAEQAANDAQEVISHIKGNMDIKAMLNELSSHAKKAQKLAKELKDREEEQFLAPFTATLSDFIGQKVIQAAKNGQDELTIWIDFTKEYSTTMFDEVGDVEKFKENYKNYYGMKTAFQKMLEVIKKDYIKRRISFSFVYGGSMGYMGTKRYENQMYIKIDWSK